MPDRIDISKAIAWAKNNVASKTEYSGGCVTCTKKAMVAAGCTEKPYGNGFYNSDWCLANGFVCIAEFEPINHQPRAHDGQPIQFPNLANGTPYEQKAGDICLIHIPYVRIWKHNKWTYDYGHMCWAKGSTINDWVSDVYQIPPVSAEGSGPYCYSDSKYSLVQFWRHSSLLDEGTPAWPNPTYMQEPSKPVNAADASGSSYADANGTSGNTPYVSGSIYLPGVSENATNKVSRLVAATKEKKNVLSQKNRKNEFESLRNLMVGNVPDMGREILMTMELYDSNILKGPQESRKERV